MKPLWLVSITLLGGAVILLELIYRHHAHAEFWWHVTPAFDLLYGFAGCIGIVLFSKWIGHAWLQRDEAFYEDDNR